MSAAKLSAVIQKRVIKILETDLRKELNTLVPELELDQEYTVKFLMSEFSLDKAKATQAFNFIISDISGRSIFTKKEVVGKAYVFSPTKSKAKDKFGAVSEWKRSVGAKLEKEYGVKDFSSKFHLGHGNSSIPAVGYRAIKAASYLAGRAGSDAMLGVLGSTSLIKGFDVEADASTVLTKSNKFKKKYTVRLKLQHGKENLKEGTEEKLLSQKLIDELQRIAIEEETSPSSVKAIDMAIDRAIRGKKPKTINEKSKAKVSYKNKKKGVKGRAGPIPRLRDRKGQFTSPTALQNIIQSQIAETVKENMGEGGSLENRTGRFAESVTITNITQSRQGTLTAFYNYMKYPYQTFERGFKQGSTRRDPRLLIHKSIREIAQKLVHRKLNIKSRRV
jgi:hypothetical protein